MVFQELGLAIVVMVSVLLICLYFMFKYVDKLIPYKKGIDLFLFLYAIESMARHYYNWTVDEKFYNYIPLQICYLTSFIYMYYYLSGDRRSLPFLHIFGFLGIGALVFPGHAFSFTNVWSYVFMIDHIVLAAMPFYIIVVHKYYPQYSTVKYTIAPLIPLFALSIPLSYFMGANYFFLISNPVTGDVLSPWLGLIIQIVLMYGFGLFATYLGQWVMGKTYEEYRLKAT